MEARGCLAIVTSTGLQWLAAVEVLARSNHGRISPISQATTRTQEGRVAARIGFLPSLILRRIVHLLPEGHQPRYYEEFRSELIEVAESGSRASQLLYVARVLWRTLDLRSVLIQSQVPKD